MPWNLTLTPRPSWGSHVFVHASAQVIGDVQLGDDSSVWCNAVLRGDVNRITVGRCSNVQDLTMGHVSHPMPASPRLAAGDWRLRDRATRSSCTAAALATNASSAWAPS